MRVSGVEAANLLGAASEHLSDESEAIGSTRGVIAEAASLSERNTRAMFVAQASPSIIDPFSKLYTQYAMELWQK